MPDELFSKYDIRGTLENQGRALSDDINSLGENTVLGTSQEDLVTYLVEKHGINPLTIDESNIHMDYDEVQIPVSQHDAFLSIGTTGPRHVTGTRLTFYVPFTGDPDLFHCRPSTKRMGLPAPSVGSAQLTFTYDARADRASGVKDTFQEDLNQIQIHAARVNEEIKGFIDALPARVRQLLKVRERNCYETGTSCKASVSPSDAGNIPHQRSRCRTSRDASPHRNLQLHRLASTRNRR